LCTHFCHGSGDYFLGFGSIRLIEFWHVLVLVLFLGTVNRSTKPRAIR
jgi:hypothetical protein